MPLSGPTGEAETCVVVPATTSRMYSWIGSEQLSPRDAKKTRLPSVEAQCSDCWYSSSAKPPSPSGVPQAGAWSVPGIRLTSCGVPLPRS